MSQLQIGTYKTISTLGSGTYGVVRLALDRNGRQVAIKTVQTGQMRADRKELVDAEVAAVQALKHKHIVEVKEIIDEEFQIHFVMECCRGGDLLQFVNSKGKLEEKEAREFFYQLCSAVEYTHKSGFIHRDLKLENVLLDASRKVKLAGKMMQRLLTTNWGYAARWAPGAKLTAALGSLHYAAPEVCSGKEYTGPEIDCWSLGVILFALVTGTLPFNADEEWLVYDMILSGTYTIPSTVSSSCASLIKKLLVVNPLMRATVYDIMQHPWVRPRHQSEGQIIALPRLGTTPDGRRHSTVAAASPPQTRNTPIDNTYTKERSRRRNSSAEDGHVPSTVTILISFNDERHELVFLRPLAWKTLKRELKKKFGKVNIRCRPDGANDLIQIRHESEWSKLDASLENSRLSLPTPLVLILSPKTTGGSALFSDSSSSNSSSANVNSSPGTSPPGSTSSSPASSMTAPVMKTPSRPSSLHNSSQNAILDTLPSGVMVTDMSGIIVYANPAAQKIFGWSNGELVGKSIQVLMPPEVARDHPSYMSHYLQSGNTTSTILNRPRALRAVRKDGSPVNVLMRVAETRNADDNERSFTTTFDDAPELGAVPSQSTHTPSSQPTVSQSPQQSNDKTQSSSPQTGTPEREKPKKGSILKKIFGV